MLQSRKPCQTGHRSLAVASLLQTVRHTTQNSLEEVVIRGLWQGRCPATHRLNPILSVLLFLGDRSGSQTEADSVDSVTLSRANPAKKKSNQCRVHPALLTRTGFFPLVSMKKSYAAVISAASEPSSEEPSGDLLGAAPDDSPVFFSDVVVTDSSG